MIEVVSWPVCMVTVKTLRRLSVRAGLPVVMRVREWVMLGEEPSVISIKARRIDRLMGIATALGMRLEELEVAVIGELRKGVRVKAWQFQDCILVHPAALGRALIGVVKRVDKKRGRAKRPSPANA